MNSKTIKKPVLEKLPKFASDLEEAIFWDTHSLTDYFDFSKPSKIKFELIESTKEESLTFRLQKNLKDRVETIAKNLGISTSSLLRMWTIEKLAI